MRPDQALSSDFIEKLAYARLAQRDGGAARRYLAIRRLLFLLATLRCIDPEQYSGAWQANAEHYFNDDGV